LDRPEFLYEKGQSMIEGDNYLLWLALDEDGSYTLGYTETPGMRETPVQPVAREPIQVEPMTISERFRLGLARLLEALMKLLPAY